MSRKQAAALQISVVCLLLAVGRAGAEVGTIEAVPAATLLLPYFECELDDDLVPAIGGEKTLFSINNASATAVLAHVTMWTDESIPTLDFDVYLTGYDTRTINVCDIFNGNLPVTASVGQDPKDTISPKGPLSQDINFASCTGRLPYTNPVLGTTLLNHIRNAHTGGPSTVFGGRCSGFDYGDTIARGYITVDATTQCSLDFPTSPAYFTGVASFQNSLWGDWFLVNNAANSAVGETLVHIEACQPGTCSFGAGDYTFYGRYVAGLGTDQREPLASEFAARYINGGDFSGGTDLCVWRDSKTSPGAPGAVNGPFTCGGNATWFPLNQADVVAFDEQEDATDLCFQGDNVSPPIGGADTCFPLETQCVSLQGGNIPGDDPTPPYPFGWMLLNLDHALSAAVGTDPFPGLAQAWVTIVMSAGGEAEGGGGRFSVGLDAVKVRKAGSLKP